MWSVGSSDWEEGLRSNPCISKRPKMPKKFSDDFVPVDYALVPRKLRSVKKRSSGSVSPQLLIRKKHNRTNGNDLSGKNGLKKLKLSMEHGVSVRPGRHGFGSTITKDEEEVAETLYALADMIPKTGKDKTKLTGEPSKLESKAFSNMEMPDSGAKVVLEKETETRTISSSGTETNSQSSNVEGLAEGVKYQSSSDVTWRESLVKNSLFSTNNEPRSVVPQQLNLENGKNSGKSLASAAVRGQHELLDSARENKNDGSSLWPGLTLKKSLHSETQRPLQSSTSKFSAISQHQLWENSVAPKKGAPFHVALRKPWKKCCTHVHISNLINELKKTDALQMQSTQAAHSEELSKGAYITSNTLTEDRNSVLPLVSTSNAVSSAAEPNSDEIRNAVLLHKRLLQDQQHTATASQFFTLQNQNLDFFPLPAGGVGGSSHGSTKVDQCAGTVAFPFLHSKSQHTIPFHRPSNYYATGASGGGTTVAHQVQLQSNLGTSNYAQARGVTALQKQQVWRTQQQQNWCDQLSEHWKAGRISASSIPNWQNVVQDGPSLLQFSPFFSPSHSPLAVLGQNYALRQQQQQPSTMPPLSLPSAREQGQTHFHYGFQGSAGYHPDTVQPALQLLCNQQL